MSTRRSFMAFTASAVAAGTALPAAAAIPMSSAAPVRDADGKWPRNLFPTGQHPADAHGPKIPDEPNDAELLALATEIKRLRTEAEQMQDSVEHLPLDDPRSTSVWVTIYEIVERGHERTATLAIMPSRTMEGLKAKAALAFEHLDTQLDGSPPHGEALEWSVCRDLLAGSASRAGLIGEAQS